MGKISNAAEIYNNFSKEGITLSQIILDYNVKDKKSFAKKYEIDITEIEPLIKYIEELYDTSIKKLSKNVKLPQQNKRRTTKKTKKRRYKKESQKETKTEAMGSEKFSDKKNNSLNNKELKQPQSLKDAIKSVEGEER